VKIAVGVPLLDGESLGLAVLHRGVERAEGLRPVAILDRRAVVLAVALAFGAL
jgi:hypothetical protein